MKAGKVMDLLQISRSTLKRYREKGILEAKKLPTGQYDFDDDSVFLLKNKHSKRLTVLYGRVSTYSRKLIWLIKCRSCLILPKAKAFRQTIAFKILPVAFLSRTESSFSRA